MDKNDRDPKPTQATTNGFMEEKVHSSTVVSNDSTTVDMLRALWGVKFYANWKKSKNGQRWTWLAWILWLCNKCNP